VVSIVGTRPEAIKMRPVLQALACRPELDQAVILTGQHAGIGQTLAPTAVPVDALLLNLAEQTAGEILETLRHVLGLRLARLRPDLVMVQGDTTSALAGALAARDCGISIAHVEAGLRSGDFQQPWPEEGNRIRIDRLSSLLFAPTEASARNLHEEGIRGSIHVTGNSGIDALLEAASVAPAEDAGARKLVLATCHRRENWPALSRIAEALQRMAGSMPVEILFLLHPNPGLQREMRRLFAGKAGVRLQEPVGHAEMVRLMARSWLILTDSGGIQEEGPALGRPVLVLRNVTERPEALDCDSIELVGVDPDRIVAAVRRLLQEPERYRHMAQPRFPFGDGHAAPRIAEAAAHFVGGYEHAATGAIAPRCPVSAI
jgi:UDP-N-acetylglucosamine 2-epimerase (non-hydrolysing)